MNNITSALLCRPVHNVDYMLQFRWHFIVLKFIMRPSSVGGGRILRRTLSVCLSVRLSVRPVRGSSFVIVYITTVLRANIQNRKTSVFDYRPASTLRTCGIFCFVYISGPHTVRRFQPHKLVLFIQRKCLVKYIIFFEKNFSKTVLTMVQYFLKSTKIRQPCSEN